MNIINNINICGRIGSLPRFKRFDSGKELTVLSIAVNQNSQTNWFEVEIWGHSASFARNLSSGDLVTVSGTLKHDEWEDKDTGNYRYKLAIISNQINKEAKGKAKNSLEKQLANT